MSRLGPEPRVNSKYLTEHRGQVVRLTGKVVKLGGATATLEASDGVQVGVHLTRDMHIAESNVEIIGTVKDDLSIKAHTHIDLGPNLDMKSVNAVVEYSHLPIGDSVLY
ncbi:hypothetical protein IAT38_000363 [Cryptococcus sp. DSM 104549]